MSYHNIGQCLPSMFPRQTINHYSLKDLFGAVNKVESIPSDVFEEGYQFVRFDTESLLMNVPLNNTINNTILDQVYQEK